MQPQPVGPGKEPIRKVYHDFIAKPDFLTTVFNGHRLEERNNNGNRSAQMIAQVASTARKRQDEIEMISGPGVLNLDVVSNGERPLSARKLDARLQGIDVGIGLITASAEPARVRRGRGAEDDQTGNQCDGP